MRTTKTISTISFNSPWFLRLKLDELVKSGLLSFYAFISHQPEDDEGGKKEHIHVFLEPSKMLQTDDIRDFVKEYDSENPNKPKTCLPFNHSKFDDWYMYALHDKRYLALKRQSRRFHYEHDNVVSSDEDYLLFKVKRIDLVSLSPFGDMQDAIEHGVTWDEYFSRGTVPIPQVAQFQTAWFLLQSNMTDRNGRATHSPKVDDSTGEILD